eukprot:2877105-Amphidinium_carterae.1
MQTAFKGFQHIGVPIRNVFWRCCIFCIIWDTPQKASMLLSQLLNGPVQRCNGHRPWLHLTDFQDDTKDAKNISTVDSVSRVDVAIKWSLLRKEFTVLDERSCPVHGANHMTEPNS